MDANTLNDTAAGMINGIAGLFDSGAANQTTTSVIASPNSVLISLYVIIGIAVLLYLLQAVLTGALARSKGYSFVGNFLLGLALGIVALIYEAGRPVSYERECVMQDRLAMQTARELYKLQRARDKAQTVSPRTTRE